MATPVPMTRTVVLDAGLDGPLATHRIEARRITMAAGFVPGRHVHNGPVVGSVEAGTVRFQVAGGPETVLHPGDAFYEPAHVPIEHFDALHADVVFLAFFPLEAGQDPEIELTG